MSASTLTFLRASAFTFMTALLMVPGLPGSVPAVEAVQTYEQLQIVEPENGSAFWSGAGEVTIRVRARPPVEAGDGQQLRVFLDQKMVGNKPTVKLTNVVRGTHEAYADIVDAAGNTLITSPSVRFTLHRPSALLPSSCRMTEPPGRRHIA